MLSLAFQSKKKRGRGGVTKILGRRLDPLLNVRGEVGLIYLGGWEGFWKEMSLEGEQKVKVRRRIDV